MKIAYGTYAIPEIPIEEALPRLAAMGYEGVEVCAADRWPTAPRKMSAAERQRVRALFQEVDLDLPALMLFVNMMAPAGSELDAQEKLFRDACALAHDLGAVAPPIIASTLGPESRPWEEVLPLVIERTTHFGEIAGAEGCRLALEPHSGALLDRPERVVALLKEVQSPSLGINFDISHFSATGFPRTETIRALVPYALHTHVKDGYLADGKVVFQLPGEGDFDYIAYFREMAAAGWTGPITVEVSAQIFNRPDYDPWPAAQFCLDTLQRARAEALGIGGSVFGSGL